MSNLFKDGFVTEQTKTPFPVSPNVDNVEITSCEFVEGGSWSAIDVTYTRAGSYVRDRMFAVNESVVRPRPWIDGDTKEAAIAAKNAVFNTQLKHIATKLGLTDVDITGCANYVEFCALINDNCKGVKLWTKTVKEASGYVKIARNQNNTQPFLQVMVPGEPCTLVYNEKDMKTLVDADQVDTDGITGDYGV